MNISAAYQGNAKALGMARAIVDKYDDAKAAAAMDWSDSGIAALHDAERSVIRMAEHFTGRDVSERKEFHVALDHKGYRHFSVLSGMGTISGAVLVERAENGEQVHFGPGVDSGIPRIRPR